MAPIVSTFFRTEINQKEGLSFKKIQYKSNEVPHFTSNCSKFAHEVVFTFLRLQFPFSLVFKFWLAGKFEFFPYELYFQILSGKFQIFL